MKPYVKDDNSGDWCYETIETFINDDSDDSNISADQHETNPNTRITYSSFIDSMNSLNVINPNNYKDEQLQTKLYSIYQLLAATNTSDNDVSSFVKAVYEFYSKLDEREHRYTLPERNQKAYFQALIEKYPILKTKKRWDFRIDDDITLFSGDNWGMQPVVKLDVFGLGEAEVVSIASSHYACDFRNSESSLAEINGMVNDYHINIDQDKLLEDMIDSIRDYVTGWEDLINSIRSASTVEELCLAVDRLNKAVMNTEGDIFQIDLFGGLIWSNIEEARHVVELMSLYYRLEFVEMSDGERLVLRPESVDDWKVFAVSEHEQWFNLSLDERRYARSTRDIEYHELGFYLRGINLINLETVLKYHQLTNSSIIPKSLLINLHHGEYDDD